MRFILRGLTLDIDRAAVEKALRNEDAEQVRTHAVEVRGRLYPVKQALRATLAAIPEARDLSSLDFTSADARRVLRRLGLRLFEERPGAPKRRR